MTEKTKKSSGKEKSKNASTLAAASLAQFFKEKNWKIITFFPNSPCAKESVKASKKTSACKAKRISQKSPANKPQTNK